MFEWLSNFVEWMVSALPHWKIVTIKMGGVKYVKGRPKRIKSGSVVFWWPVTTEIALFPVVRQADDLRSQTLVTRDDKVIVVGGMVITEIADALVFGTSSYDGGMTIIELTLTAVHDVICKMTWDELKQEQQRGTLDTKLKNAAKGALQEYGVNVLKVMLTDMAPARVFKLLQATSSDGQ